MMASSIMTQIPARAGLTAEWQPLGRRVATVAISPWESGILKARGSVLGTRGAMVLIRLADPNCSPFRDRLKFSTVSSEKVRNQTGRSRDASEI
jgi:hypothetical protein